MAEHDRAADAWHRDDIGFGRSRRDQGLVQALGLPCLPGPGTGRSGLAGTTALAASISSTTRSRSSGAGAAASCTSLRASVPPGTIALGAMDCAASRKARASGPRVVTTTGWSSPGAVFGAWASSPAARA